MCAFCGQRIPYLCESPLGRYTLAAVNRSVLFSKLWILILRELRNWIRSPILALTFIIGPALWVFVFGNAFNAAFFASGGNTSSLQGAPNYFNFIATGMFVVLPMAFASRTGATIFADRFKGYLDRLLVSPTSRGTIVLSKIFAGVILGAVQATALLILSVPLGVTIPNFSVLSLTVLLLAVVMLSYGFSSVFLMVSMRIRRFPTQQMVGSLITTPLM
ncbi:MAG: ABC transporter permease, partial [Nitrososphaerales archaeon]